MISRFWTQWIIVTSAAIVGACMVGAIMHSWIAGIVAYFGFGILKDSYLLTVHLKTLDNKSKSL